MNALIVYASMTGNTEEACDVMMAALEDLGVTCEMESSLNIFGEDFLDVDICVLGTYTYGAELPEEIIDLYEDLDSLDLSQKVFVTLGSGDHAYEAFCQSVDDCYQQFIKAGAHPAAPPIKIELDCKQEDISTIEVAAASAFEWVQSHSA